MWGTITCVSVASVLVAFLFIKHRRSLKKHMCRSAALLTGKTVIVTGANSGIGFETALDLAKRGAKVILACRSVRNGEMTALCIRKQTGNQQIRFCHLDLASIASIRAFAENILELEPHIDTLINNAGILYPVPSSTEDGFELHMGVNHLGHFLLTLLLLDRLKESQPSRIITVSSVLYKTISQFDFETMNNVNESRVSSNPSRHTAYCQSKLANVLFTRELARRLNGTSVTANVVSPGVVHTGLGRHSFQRLPFLLKPLAYILLPLLFKTPWEGAQTTIHCALSKEVERVSGQFFRDCKQTPLLTDVSKDDQVAKKLWEISARMMGVDCT